MAIAPALIPKRSGEPIKTNRRDAVTLARLHRAGELTGVWAPDAAHEAVRDLVRSREAAADDLRRKRQHGRIYSGGGHCTLAHRRWLAGQKFEHIAQQFVFQEKSTRSTMLFNDSVVSRSSSPSSCRSGPWRLSSKLARPCAALRFSSLSPSSRRSATCDASRRPDIDVLPWACASRELDPRHDPGKGLTLAGNRQALIEAVWTYRYAARVSEALRTRLDGLPKPVRNIAWKAQVRLCARYRRLGATGKKLPMVVAAIPRETAAFLWAIGTGGRASVSEDSFLPLP